MIEIGQNVNILVGGGIDPSMTATVTSIHGDVVNVEISPVGFPMQLHISEVSAA